MNLNNFTKHSDWVKVWSGKWSLHSCSQFGVSESAHGLVVYVHRSSIVDAWFCQNEKDKFGLQLVSEVATDSNKISQLADDLKSHAKSIFLFIKKNSSSRITPEIYDNFWREILNYYPTHLRVKYIVDYLSAVQLKKYLPILQEARLYSEPVYRDQEDFMECIAAQVAKDSAYTQDQILCTTKEELQEYFRSGELPDKQILDMRFIISTQLFELGESLLFAGKEAAEMEKIVLPDSSAGLVKGQIAYKGKAQGKVRLVIDPFKYKGAFEMGDILVTGMTRPEFLPLMEKAAAFITDAGGILSHAAIMAREMKKPCVIGTGVATKVLKDGDLVEVDAENGIVRKL